MVWCWCEESNFEVEWSQIRMPNYTRQESAQNAASQAVLIAHCAGSAKLAINEMR